MTKSTTGNTIDPNGVDHPGHYNVHPSGVECIEVVRHHNFNIGSAIKYLWRQGLKEGQPSIKELRKAIWYIQDELKRMGVDETGMYSGGTLSNNQEDNVYNVIAYGAVEINPSNGLLTFKNETIPKRWKKEVSYRVVKIDRKSELVLDHGGGVTPLYNHSPNLKENTFLVYDKYSDVYRDHVGFFLVARYVGPTSAIKGLIAGEIEVFATSSSDTVVRCIDGIWQLCDA